MSAAAIPDEELATRGWTMNSGRYLEEVLGADVRESAEMDFGEMGRCEEDRE